MPYVNYNPYNTPYPFNPDTSPPRPHHIVVTDPWAGPQQPPKGPYGKLSNDGFLINYIGLTSETAEVIVDNVNRYIKVNSFTGRLRCLEKDPALHSLKEGDIWFNTTEDVVKYFDGIKIVSFDDFNIEYLTEEDIDLIWETVDGSL